MKKYKILLSCLYADFGQDGQIKPDFSNSSWEYENIYKPWKRLTDEGVIDLETHWLDTQNNQAGYDRLMQIVKDCDFVFQVAVNHSLSITNPIQIRLSQWVFQLWIIHQTYGRALIITRPRIGLLDATGRVMLRTS